MKQLITVSKEKKSDHAQVFHVHLQAFGRPNEGRLVDALRANAEVFIPELSIVARDDGRVVGHILFTRINIRHEAGTVHESLALAPVAVIPVYQGIGIGGRLINEGLAVAKRLGFRSVIVLGHENYYPKYGFKPADKWNIKCPFEVPSNAFMALELEDGSLGHVSGTVVYPKEFDAA